MNPFAVLAQLALDIHRFEQDRYFALPTGMQALSHRNMAVEATLLEAADRARAACRGSGWAAKDVHETVTALVEGCRRLMEWATLRGDWHALSDAVLRPLRDVQAMAAQYHASPTNETPKISENGDETPPGDLTATERNKRITEMEPSVRKAYLAYQYAESKKGRRLEDLEAYDVLKEEGIPEDAGKLGELTDYKVPPSCATFVRYLGLARNALREQKYTSRKGRSHGKSIVQQNEIEQLEDDD